MSSKSVTAIVFYVADADKTRAFLEQLELPVTQPAGGHLRVSLGAVELEFHDERLETIAEFIAEAKRRPKGAGLYIYVKCNELEAYRSKLLAKGLITATEITARPWGNSEFIVTDPDGYKFTFYRKIVKN